MSAQNKNFNVAEMAYAEINEVILQYFDNFSL